MSQALTRSQLAVVDLPGVIQAGTNSIDTPDNQMVKEITNHHPSQPCTINLPVIAATRDYANQTGILTKVHDADLKGKHILGVITKADRLQQGSSQESTLLSLERNQVEDARWPISILGRLPAETRGVKATLGAELETALSRTNTQLAILGTQHHTAQDCRRYLGETHVDAVFDMCYAFFNTLLREMCPAEIRSRLSTLNMIDALEHCRATATTEFENLVQDMEDFPTVYNHHYTETVQNRCKARVEAGLTWCMENATEYRHLDGCQSSHILAQVNIHAAVAAFYGDDESDMSMFSSQEALEHMLSIYKTTHAEHEETIMANVTSQVVKRHMFRDLDKTLLPVAMAD